VPSEKHLPATANHAAAPFAASTRAVFYPLERDGYRDTIRFSARPNMTAARPSPGVVNSDRRFVSAVVA